MQYLSRRALAAYAADRLSAGAKERDIARQLAAVLVATKRTAQLGQLRQDIAYELEDRGLAAHARLTTARRLNSSITKQVEKFIARHTAARHVSIEAIVDESIIGGMALETAKFKWDQTIKRKLTDIRETF